MQTIARWVGSRLHYAWIVAGAVFLALLTAAGVRSMPGVLLIPLMNDLGWIAPRFPSPSRSVLRFTA